MDWGSLIRRLMEGVRRRAWEGAAFLLFGAAMVAGYGSVLSGAVSFAGALTPGMAAEASDEPVVAGASLPLTGFSAVPRYSPQILFPVTGHFFPAWMTVGRGSRLASMPVAAAMTVTASTLPIPRPGIAICIDDLGEDLAGTDKAIALPREVAMSFLPYAEATPFLAQEAESKGHAVLAHVPMEALSRTNPGAMALQVGAPDNSERLAWNIFRVPGLVGINNHEGSRFTEDAASVALVARVLAEKKLFFFDSRTVPDSKVVSVARQYGVMSASRDIFLDNVVSEEAVRRQLDALAAEAKRNGVAIAIGHPHDATLKVVAAWLAENHGVELVPLPEAIRRKSQGLTLEVR
ncbi:MAG TPA: divergent polysaccharide deacetylase family protein [Rhizomicrobium sp.]|nr:divergent polysaccharide deacetylase family protein [Rhizomicrobium sp.]